MAIAHSPRSREIVANIWHALARHREALAEAHDALGRALVAPEIALAAEDLRLALRAIGRITGKVRVEELLDVIFRDFCIGK